MSLGYTLRQCDKSTPTEEEPVKDAKKSLTSRLSTLTRGAIRVADTWHDKPHSVVWIPLTLTALGSVGLEIVYLSGGTHTAALHIVYVPIFLAAVWYGVPGGAMTGLLIGFALGPFMPLNVAGGISQSVPNWLTRLVFLTLFGTLAGLVMTLIRDYAATLRNYAFVSRDSGLPTVNRFAVELEAHSLPRLLIIAITNFDHIAHTVGFDTARRLPAVLYDHLIQLLPSSSLCCELGPGRLAIAVFDPDAAATLDEQRLAERLLEPLSVGGTTVYVETALGQYVPVSDDERDPDELVRRASSALLNGQDNKTPIRTYTAQLDADTRENVRLLTSLRTGLDENRVFLVYQPKVDLRSHAVIGVEALVRLTDTDGQTVSPGRFVPLAENSTVIHLLTDTVIRQAIAQLAAWHQAGYPLHMAINFSVRNLQTPAALGALARALEQQAIAPDNIEIEVTESAMIQDPAAFHRVVAEARNNGVRVALDDFGAGYTTLGYLSALPVNVIKIDQSLIRPMAEEPRRAAIVRSIITLCRNLDFRVTAEGVETETIYRMLQSAGCHEAQGYLLARPMPAAALPGWLHAWQRGSVAKDHP